MKTIIKIFCKILKWIEELLMKLIPTICGKRALHLPIICENSDRFIGAEDVSIIQGTEFDPLAGVTAVDATNHIVPFTVEPSELPSLCELGTFRFLYKTETFVEERYVTITQAEAPTITLPTDAMACDSAVCETTLDPNTAVLGEPFSSLSGVSAVDAHGNSVAVVCTEGNPVTFTTSGEHTIHYTATDECGNVGTASRIITVVAGHFEGISTASVPQGTDFDLTSGVKAYSYSGEEIAFTVTPSEFVPCQVGQQTYTYKARGVEDVVRTITVTAIADPTISGITEPITVGKGVEFNPLDGVSAVDGNGNTLTVTVQVKGE